MQSTLLDLHGDHPAILAYRALCAQNRKALEDGQPKAHEATGATVRAFRACPVDFQLTLSPGPPCPLCGELPLFHDADTGVCTRI